jgi:hypothetical protein
VLSPANDESFALFINDSDDPSSPTIRRLSDFIGVNPIFYRGRTIACRARQARPVSVTRFDFNLSPANEFVTAPAKPSIIKRNPLSQRVDFA